jgi:hypothetical protein
MQGRDCDRLARHRSSSATRCIAFALTKDGLVYVCDRINNRLQIGAYS